MTTSSNPFLKPKAAPGTGTIRLSLLPPSKQVLHDFNYQYPLKLISPDPHYITKTGHETQGPGPDQPHQSSIHPVTTIFLLTYGGGLLSGDQISLRTHLSPGTRLVLLTQGSTKIFKFNTGSPPTKQTLDIDIESGASLCYLPDPTQPFRDSVYEQYQKFAVAQDGQSNLLVLDWVSEGRKARGENWDLTSWSGRNEVRFAPSPEQEAAGKQGRLLLRDALYLYGQDIAGRETIQGIKELANKTDNVGIIGTLIVYGPMFKSLQDFWMHEFQNIERIGGRDWSSSSTSAQSTDGVDGRGGGMSEKQIREKEERKHGFLWTAAMTRGFVLVKFGARDLDFARIWLGRMLRREGTVEREFGHQALLCLR